MPASADEPWIDFLNNYRKRFSNTLLIIAPPRTCSTAFSRLFWGSHHSFSNEPCERCFYLNEPTDQGVIDALSHRVVRVSDDADPSRRIVIKAMSFSVFKSGALPRLLSLLEDQKSLIFLIRDPRRSAHSRLLGFLKDVGNFEDVICAERAGVDPADPSFSGFWQLEALIQSCRSLKVPFVIVDSSDIRNNPESLVPALFSHLGLECKEEVFQNWKPRPDLNIDNMNGSMTHLYERAMTSVKLEKETAEAPTLDQFAGRKLRKVVEDSLSIYQRLLASPERLKSV